jgi:metallophosphoesterase (TIGR03767 family)
VLVARSFSRREFLKLSVGAAAGTQLARLPFAEALAGRSPHLAPSASHTTLGRTIVKGSRAGQGAKADYFRLAFGEGEPHLLRADLGPRSASPIRLATSFVQLTDVHLVDAQSPARVEFLDRYDDGSCPGSMLNAAFRAHETLTVQVLESMIRRLRRIGVGPVARVPFRFVVATGDNTDNEQLNELRWFVDTMDGGGLITPNSGGPDYEGVQAASWGDGEYWHPNAGLADKYKLDYGFPDAPGLLGQALQPFRAKGVGMRWIQALGNHDGLIQGNVHRNDALNQIAIGPAKFTGPPPAFDPCNPLENLLAAPTTPVTADPRRRTLRRSDYIEQMFHTTGTPVGHGFRQRNRDDGTAYFTWDREGWLRFITLDTVNPGGYDSGSIGQTQFDWLERRLIAAHSRYFDANGNPVRTTNTDRVVVLFSHHGLRSLDNPNTAPDPDDPGSNDLPRIMADQVEALVHRFPNVVAWVNGHTHDNVITARPDPAKLTHGFWDIGTAAHIDWTSQSRIVELAVRRDGSISIWCTIFDHDAPADPRGLTGLPYLASLHRELTANDYQYGFASKGPGEPPDRNVELTLPPLPWLRRQ